MRSHDHSNSLQLNYRGIEFRFAARKDIFLFSTARDRIQNRIQRVPSQYVNTMEGWGRNWPPSYNAEFKYAWSHTSTSLRVFMAWCLIKHRDFIIQWYVVTGSVVKLTVNKFNYWLFWTLSIHLKKEAESRLRNIVLNKEQDDIQCPKSQ
jgi:hypothetical protein